MHIKGMGEPTGCNMRLIGVARMTDDTWLKTYGDLRRQERTKESDFALVSAPTFRIAQPTIAPGTAAKIHTKYLSIFSSMCTLHP